MDQSLYDQIISLTDKSRKILLLTHAKADCDGLGAALSMYLILKEMGKEITVVTNDPAKENQHFMPAIDILQNSLAGSSDFIISLDTSKTPIGKIKYSTEDNRLNIIITPKNGVFSEGDVSFEHGKNKYDLIFILDTGNFEHLGPIYDANVEMFYETPVINIDHHSSNTDFGQINLVNVTAASTTEVLYEFLAYWEKKLNRKLITEDIATLLLAGIITDTGSFQHANTSPRAMETASKLLDLGARQQEIIKNIYKTKKLSTLKLWGIVLSKIQVDPVHRMVWSAISKEDLQEADASSEETEGIIDDLLTNAPGAEIIFLIKHNPDCVSVSMRSTGSQIDVGKLCAEMGGGGHARAAGFKVRDGRPFDQVVSEVVAKVREFQAERLNIHEDNLKKPEMKPDTAPTKEVAVEAQHIAPQGEQLKPEQPKQSTYLEFKAPKTESEGVKQNAESEDTNPHKQQPNPDKPKKRHRKRKHKKKTGAAPTEGGIRQSRPTDEPPRPEKPKPEQSMPSIPEESLMKEDKTPAPDKPKQEPEFPTPPPIDL
ncbi:DHH family phosphoesterase [Candidatus Peregrinibacteria bacterium]|nr:DHH family phosphoesterase [Candidatus Peregrinibacteria bacterium]